MSEIELWYIELAYNNLNSPCYADMMEDIRRIGNGVFSATVKINDGTICDYVVMENDNFSDDYVKPGPTKTH